MPNTLDVLKINNSEELIGLVEDAVKVSPEVNFFDASPVIRNSYKTLCLTADPVVGFRAAGAQRTYNAPTLVEKDTACKYLDAGWQIESLLAEQSDWGKEMAFSIMLKSHLRAAFNTLAKQIWYGTNADATGFPGLAELFDSSNANLIIDAGATMATTSVFAVRTGFDSLQIAWGSEGRFIEGDVKEQRIGTGSAGSDYYVQKVGGWAGLQVTAAHSFGRIRNIGTAANTTLTDDRIYELLAQFPSGQTPTALFMSRRSLEQLRKSRTPVTRNATGVPAPTPTDVGGIPIYVTDAIINNENSFYAPPSPTMMPVEPE